MSTIERYEIKAHAFHSMTGMMAPGKDEPAASGGHDMFDRIAAWEKWNTENIDLIDAMLHAFDKVRE